MKRWQIIVLVLLFLLLVGGGGTAVVVATRKGKKLLKEWEAGPDGIVHHDPRDLVKLLEKQTGTSIGIDIAALASMIDSEHPSDLHEIRVAVAHIAHNMAKKNHESLSALLLRGSHKNPNTKVIEHTASNGFFGAQNTGKYATTAHSPTADGLQIAIDVMSGKIADTTGGALQFDVPRAQRAGHAAGKKGYDKSPEQVAADRRAAGMELALLPGVPEEHFRAWRKRGGIG